jgi:NTP pyrophosphatase (non-canonical NTP hydrolase)
MNMLAAAIALSATLCAAEEAFDLKINMLKLNAEVGEAREAMIRNEKEAALDAFRRLKADANELLSNKSKIESLLPAEKRNKADVAVESARKIAKNVEIIEDAFGANKRNVSPLKRQATAQRAYTSIEVACFHCHNLVRD